MGAAVSSNTAKSIAKVSNNVSNSTNVSANQVNAVQQAINFDSCYLNMSGDINIQSASSMVAKSTEESICTNILKNSGEIMKWKMPGKYRETP